MSYNGKVKGACFIAFGGQVVLLSLLWAFALGSAYQFNNNPNLRPTTTTTATTTVTTGTTAVTSSRRKLLQAVGTAAAAALAIPFVNQLAALADDKPDTGVPASSVDEESVYFGVGCFWHIQHEFVAAEMALLDRRRPEQLTSTTGYAGGLRTDNEGRVCYHNLQMVADYNQLGHCEVVGMQLPSNKIVDFAKVYFALFDPRTLDRVDPQDRGSEYRSAIGLKGGVKHPSYVGVQQAAQVAGFTLLQGKGNDPDTLGKKSVYVYDTSQFPFYQGEVYHQYHNDFQSPAYGRTYNSLAMKAFEEGRLKVTGCPDRV